MIKSILPYCFLFLCINTLGQDSLNKRNPGIIYQKNKLAAWRMNGDKLSQRELKPEINKVPAAIPFYKKAKSNLWAALFSSITTFTVVSLMSKETDLPYQKKYGYLLAGLGGTGLTTYFLIRYNYNFRKAVKIRNEKAVMLY